MACSCNLQEVISFALISLYRTSLLSRRIRKPSGEKVAAVVPGQELQQVL